MPKVTGNPTKTIRPLKPVEVEWGQKEIRVLKVEHGVYTTIPVSALTYSNLAIHPDPFKEGKWAVTCLPLGARLALLDTDEDAVGVAEYLHDHCRDALSGKTESVVKAATPAWVQEWCKQLNAAGKWIDPKVG